ncbi:uncharacterized protein LOC114245990 [Bombyx mandarina]|uniref:Uncharacterized protein LOC114245990 n=1 Tax=Bombyx mandarina TaxID=7092 RepID=A0A6J2JZD9_BOMMA|nr:uncharacterized protein LOC114245990 [Bombyx mandarina]
MYTDTDDISDRESEYEERSPEDSPKVTKKSLSTVGFRSSPENLNNKPMALRATQSFTGAIEELKANFQINLCDRVTPIKVTTVCPCGCLLRPCGNGPFRTREKNTLALHVVSPEVLNYHGYSFEPNQIAMFWKKDCRKFLWKGKSKVSS